MSIANSTHANRRVSNKLTYLLTYYKALYAYRLHSTYSTTLVRLAGPQSTRQRLQNKVQQSN